MNRLIRQDNLPIFEMVTPTLPRVPAILEFLPCPPPPKLSFQHIHR